MEPKRVGVNHIAIAYPDREAWLTQLEHLKANGVEFIVRGNHGMTHSAYIADPDGYGIEVLYDLPEEVWSGDVDAALNYFEYLPPEQELEDTHRLPALRADAPEPVAVPGRVVTRESRTRAERTTHGRPHRRGVPEGSARPASERCGSATSGSTTSPSTRRSPAPPHALAAVFDRQHEYPDDCLMPDPETGEPINVSHMIPRSKDDLKRRHAVWCASPRRRSA